MKKRILRNQKGFTLIEIIAVLVILGILAAVAIPKYLDMQQAAREKSAQAAISEVRARATSAYAKYLLNNSGNTPSVAQVITDVGAAPDLGPDYAVTFTASGSDALVTISSVQSVALTANNTGTWSLPSTQ